MPQNDQQFLWVKMPDGSYGKFNAGTPDATIRATILKNFPDAYSKTPAAQPGAFQTKKGAPVENIHEYDTSQGYFSPRNLNVPNSNPDEFSKKYSAAHPPEQRPSGF